jgi:hypothetical protein
LSIGFFPFLCVYEKLVVSAGFVWNDFNESPWQRDALSTQHKTYRHLPKSREVVYIQNKSTKKKLPSKVVDVSHQLDRIPRPLTVFQPNIPFSSSSLLVFFFFSFFVFIYLFGPVCPVCDGQLKVSKSTWSLLVVTAMRVPADGTAEKKRSIII